MGGSRDSGKKEERMRGKKRKLEERRDNGRKIERMRRKKRE